MILRAFAAAFAVAALLHAVALVAPTVLEPSPPWRHAVFVVVNALFAAALVRRPRWLLPATLLLAAQQLVSHGRFAMESVAREGTVPLPSLAVLLAIPVLVVAVIADAREVRACAPARGAAASSRRS